MLSNEFDAVDLRHEILRAYCFRSKTSELANDASVLAWTLNVRRCDRRIYEKKKPMSTQSYRVCVLRTIHSKQNKSIVPFSKLPSNLPKEREVDPLLLPEFAYFSNNDMSRRRLPTSSYSYNIQIRRLTHTHTHTKDLRMIEK